MKQEDFYDRFKGCLYGQAIGDAYGLGTEGMTDENIVCGNTNKAYSIIVRFSGPAQLPMEDCRLDIRY